MRVIAGKARRVPLKTLEGMEFIGKFGRVVDLIYKIGNQWDTY